MKRSALSFLVVCLALASAASANPHFQYQMGPSSHSLFITGASIEGESLGAADEIGVFTPADLCAGACLVGVDENGDTLDGDWFPVGIAAWGDDPITDFTDGFLNAEAFNFRFWDASVEQEIPAMVSEWIDGSQNWIDGGFTVLTLVNVPDLKPVISVRPENLDFGAILSGESTSLVLTVFNIGDTTLSITDLSTSAPFEALFEAELPIESGENQELLVTFAPQEIGEFEGTLRIVSNDAENDTLEVPLTGSGLFNSVKESPQRLIPREFFLANACPNPFNPTTRLTFGLPEAGMVRLAVFDMSGRLVDIVDEGEWAAGVHSVQWNAERLPSGLYLASLEGGGQVVTKKLMLVR